MSHGNGNSYGTFRLSEHRRSPLIMLNVRKVEFIQYKIGTYGREVFSTYGSNQYNRYATPNTGAGIRERYFQEKSESHTFHHGKAYRWCYRQEIRYYDRRCRFITDQTDGSIMLGLSATYNYFLFNGSVDMRKGCFRLAEVIREEMQDNPLNTENVYMFMSKNRKQSIFTV